MADEVASVEVAGEEAHNQWSMDKEYSAGNSPPPHRPAKYPSRAMPPNSSQANPLPLELAHTSHIPHESQINPDPVECRNPKLQILLREHMKILQTGNTNVLSVRMRYYPIRRFGAVKLAGLFYIYPA
jgi:hypothetical protein